MESIWSEQATTRQPRRTFTKQFKAQLVAQVDDGQYSIAQIALENRINANLLHKWVALAREAEQSDTSFELTLDCGTFRFSKCWDPAAVALLIKSLV